MKYPGLYIHVPFCRSKCPYCGFYSIASSSLIPGWIESLKKEIFRYRGRFTGPFDSLYLGGGTPTVLDPEQLKGIISCVSEIFQLMDDSEVTIEANPGDMDMDRAKTLRDTGFNRVNLGVQSFHDDELIFLGRRHDAGEAVEAVESLRAAGFDNIGIDLIYGLPGQGPEAWMENLERAVSLCPEHISCYQLTIEEDTPFMNMKKRGLIDSPGEEMEEAMFLAASEFLGTGGYIHYEVSNFARGEGCYARHNRKYWDHTPYLGLGPSAHSFDGGARWWNFRSVRRYCGIVEGGEDPVEGREALTDDQLVMETVSLGLRTIWGFDVGVLQQGRETDDVISMLEGAGYINVRDGRILPTERGFLVADRLPLYFLS